MTPSTRAFHRLAVIGALVAALGMAACGRKGTLDPPPTAVVEPDLNAPAVIEPDLDAPAGRARRGLVQTPRGPNKRLPIDFLLD